MSETTTKITLADLQAGDMVILREGYVHAVRSVVKVKRVTDKQIVIGVRNETNEWKFRKDNGAQIGAHEYSSPRRLLIATNELLAEVAAEHKLATLAEFRFRLRKEQKELINEVFDFLESKKLL